MPLNNWLSVLRNKFSAPPRLRRRQLRPAGVFRAVEGYESRILLSATTTSSDGTDAVGPLQPDYSAMLSMYSTGVTTTGSVADQTATAYMGSMPDAGFGLQDLSGSAATAGTELEPVLAPTAARSKEPPQASPQPR